MPSPFVGARSPAWSIAVVVSVYLALTARLIHLADRYAVDLVVGDQWDLYAPFAKEHSLWELFRFQFGPHRQGIGMWLTDAVLNAGEWNTRWESFLIAALLAGASLVALLLKSKVTSRLELSDVAIPLIVLTVAQIDTLVLVPNNAHSATPLLIVLLMAHVSTFSGAVRMVAMPLLLLAASHTGFAIFALPAFLLVRVAEAVARRKRGTRPIGIVELVEITATLVAAALFVTNYTFFPAANCFRLLSPDIAFIPTFVSTMFARFVGLSFRELGFFAATVGSIAAMGVFLAALLGLRGSARSESPGASAVAFLSSFSIIFAVATAWGRVCLNPAYGESSRYMTLLIPGFLACYLAALHLRSRSIAAVVIAGAILGSVLTASETSRLARSKDSRDAWKSCYERTHDFRACSAESGLVNPPRPDAVSAGIVMQHLERMKNEE